MKKSLLTILWIIWTTILWNSFVTASNGFLLTNEYVNWINVPRTDETDNSDPEALYIIIRVSNRILGLTSVVALIMFLIWGYKVLTAWWDDSKSKWWFKIIKNAIIWLLIIWLARAMVRFIFRFVGRMGWDWNFNTGWEGGW